MRALRVLHIPADVGGHAIGLAKAERQHGLQSRAVLFQTGGFGYNADENLKLETVNMLFAYIQRFLYFFKVVMRYDIFHFYFGESIMPFNIDLPILKLFGKKIFFTFQGCDIRLRKARGIWNGQPFVLQHHCICNQKSDFRKRLHVWFIHLFVTKSYILNPDLSLSSPTSEILPYAHLDIPSVVPTTYVKKNSGLVVVVHAPTDRRLKGTTFIEKAISDLQGQGYPIELKILEHKKQSEILELCSKADFAIDQVLIGWYGAFAVEMMALGIPVICYLDERFAPIVPYYGEIPIINASEKNLQKILEDILQKRSHFNEVGIKSRQFALTVHDPMKIAKRLIFEYTYAH